jgi:protein-tyrosine phosphatase
MQKEATMPTFSQSIEINATPDKVWAVLGDLASVHQWIPGISAVTVDGTSRVCTFADGHTQNEQILDYSPSARSYRYRIDDAPLPVTDNIGSFAVRPGDGHTRVVWESSFQPLDPAMTEQLAQIWQPYLPTALGNLKNLIEK